MTVLIAKPANTFGAHCHQRVLMALEILQSATKDELAVAADTTPAVVSNAIHDWKKGLHTRDGQALFVEVERVNRKAVYSLPQQLELF